MLQLLMTPRRLLARLGASPCREGASAAAGECQDALFLVGVQAPQLMFAPHDLADDHESLCKSRKPLGAASEGRECGVQICTDRQA